MLHHSHPPDVLFSRRAAIARVIALAGGLALRPPLSMAADSVELPFTPENVLGPFYPLNKPLDRDGDLTRLRGRKESAQGTVMDLSGRVLDLKGTRCAAYASRSGRPTLSAGTHTRWSAGRGLRMPGNPPRVRRR